VLRNGLISTRVKEQQQKILGRVLSLDNQFYDSQQRNPTYPYSELPSYHNPLSSNDDLESKQ
jgi:hypothetical protein